MSLIDQIKKLADENALEVIAWQRHLHQHPELSFKEFKTSLFVQEKLDEMGIPFRAGIAQTGVLGCIKGKNPNRAHCWFI